MTYMPPVFFQCQTHQAVPANQALSFYSGHSPPIASLPSALVMWPLHLGRRVVAHHLGQRWRNVLHRGSEFSNASESVVTPPTSNIGCLGNQAQAALEFSYSRVIPVQLGAPPCDIWTLQEHHSLPLGSERCVWQCKIQQAMVHINTFFYHPPQQQM